MTTSRTTPRASMPPATRPASKRTTSPRMKKTKSHSGTPKPASVAARQVGTGETCLALFGVMRRATQVSPLLVLSAHEVPLRHYEARFLARRADARDRAAVELQEVGLDPVAEDYAAAGHQAF